MQLRRVSASYFETMRIRLRRGRVFERTDSLSTPAVALISQAFADRYWPGVDPIGRRVKRGPSWMTVVGVVDEVSDVDLLQPPEPTLYAAWTQTANVAFPMGLVPRTGGEPETIAPPLRGGGRGRRRPAGRDRGDRRSHSRVPRAAAESPDDSAHRVKRSVSRHPTVVRSAPTISSSSSGRQLASSSSPSAAAR